MWISILTGASISLRWRCGIYASVPLTAITGTTFRDPLCFHSVCSSRPVSALYNQFLVLECPQDLCARLVHVAHQQQVNMLEAAEARGENVDLMRSILEETFAHKLEILEDPEQNVARYFFLTKVRILSFVYVSPISAPSVTGAPPVFIFATGSRQFLCSRIQESLSEPGLAHC